MPQYTVTAFDVVSLAKILGAIGLLWGLVVAIGWLVVGGSVAGRPGAPALLITVIGAGLYGLIGGAITAVLYNAVASLVGGIELELSGDTTELADS